MERFVFNLTNRCNFRCTTCFRGDVPVEDLSCTDVSRIIPVLARMGVKTIALTGGEPILSPCFEDVLKLIVKHGFGAGVVTNGWLYRDYASILDRYRQSIRYIALSLDGHTAALHDAVRKAGSFDRVMAAMRVFGDKGYKIHVGHILNRHNYSHMMDLCELLKPFHSVVCMGRVIKTKTNTSVQLTPEQESTLRARIHVLFQKYGGMISPTSSIGMSNQPLFCTNFFTMEDVTLRFDGKIVFCCDAPIEGPGPVLGDIRQESVDDIVPRFGRKLGQILSERLKACAEGKPETRNNCDFCSGVLSRLAGAE
jgi:MoaA/NifB/PqqE/SkfB family radical SAM enzyme